MSQIYEAAGLGDASTFLSTAVPILTLGLVMSIIFGAIANKIGHIFPKMSGDGRLSRKEMPEDVKDDQKKEVSARSCASGFLLATAYYIMGVILNKIIPPIMGVSIHAFAYMVILLAVICGSVLDAFAKIADGKYPFVSRGDNSGTHTKELSLWPESLGISEDPKSFADYTQWYTSANAGMGACLVMAEQMHAYILTDKATFLTFVANNGVMD